MRGPAANVLEHDRFAGYQRRPAAHGTEPGPRSWCGPATSPSRRAKRRPERYLALSRKLPDAVFACNDAMAMGADPRLCRRPALSVPGNVSVAGFDDIEFAAAYNPALTTVRQARGEIGARAAAMLVDLIEGGQPAGPGRSPARRDHRARQHPPALIERLSAADPRVPPTRPTD